MVMAWEMLSGMPVVQRPHGREEIVAKMLLLNVWTSTPPAATPRAGPTIPGWILQSCLRCWSQKKFSGIALASEHPVG